MTITIGLTGGIGSGKSSVANFFSELNIPVFDTYTLARELFKPDKPAL
jgi:dephospho-CoA kinase